MPTASQHSNKAAANRRFLATISTDDHPDWVVVAAFYAAVHLVEQLRAMDGCGDSTGHDDRLAFVQERHRAIHTAYHALQNNSMLARYESNATFRRRLTREEIADVLAGRYLVAIEAYVAEREKPPPETA